MRNLIFITLSPFIAFAPTPNTTKKCPLKNIKKHEGYETKSDFINVTDKLSQEF